MEIAGITLDLAALPWPIFVISILVLGALIWYLTSYMGLVKEHEELKTSYSESLALTNEYIKTLTDRTHEIEINLRSIKEDMNGISSRHSAEFVNLKDSITEIIEESIDKIHDDLERDIDKVNNTIERIILVMTTNRGGN